MKQTYLIMWLCVASVCYAEESCIVCRSDSGELVLTKASTMVKTNSKSVALVGVDRVLAAIQLYERAEEQNIQIRQIDISIPQYVQATLQDGKRVRINWRQMGVGSKLSERDLDARLGGLSAVINADQSDRVSMVDLSDSDALSATSGPTVGRHKQDNISRKTGVCLITYVVNKGDTISTIAKLFGISRDDLQEANGFSDNEEIIPGQIMIVPAIRREPKR